MPVVAIGQHYRQARGRYGRINVRAKRFILAADARQTRTLINLHGIGIDDVAVQPLRQSQRQCDLPLAVGPAI